MRAVAIAVVIDDARHPLPPIFGRRQIREDRGVLYRDLFLVVIAILDPGLHLGAVERSGDEPLVERVLVVIALSAYGAQARDEVGA